jgi:four helix bundle protein
MVNKRFEDLKVWQRSAQLCENVFLYFNSKKCYQLKDHISRTVLSISSNIVEGFERNSDREFIRFLIYAKGSCGEFRSQTSIGIKTNYIDIKTENKWREESIEISSMLTGLIKTRKSLLVRDLNKKN